MRVYLKVVVFRCPTRPCAMSCLACGMGNARPVHRSQVRAVRLRSIDLIAYVRLARRETLGSFGRVTLVSKSVD